MAKQAEYFYEFGPFRVDPVQRLLWRDGQLVPLMPKVFDTLLLLVENNGQVLEKGELMQELWPDSFVEEGSLSHNVSVLRKLLSAGPGQYIETLPRRGYRFTSDVRQVQNTGANVIVYRRTRSRVVATEEYETEDEPLVLASLPNNLSLPTTPIVGRENEIAAIENLLMQKAARIVTLTGVGGTGKTRLAQEVACRLLSKFTDGAFFVALDTVRQSDLVASTIAQTLGVKETGGKSLLESLTEFLREKQMLLIIDNFEQVLVAASVLSQLVSASPRLKILATSRALLHVAGEKELVVQPLALPDLTGETKNLPECASIKLFIERAHAIKPALDFSAEENLCFSVEICRRLDGLPLGIELAAARVKILSLPAILQRLENRLKLLTGGAKNAPSRQQTMRGAIEWSFDLLEEGEQISFRRLSIFAGSFSIEAAESICAADEFDLLNCLTALVENSLLTQIEQANGESRFRLLEVVREYALEKLELSGESDLLRKNHASFFLALAENAESEFSGADAAKWLNRFDDEHENLRAALGWSIENETETALRLAGATQIFWNIRGYLTEARGWLEAALEKAGQADAALRWKALLALGQTARYQGDMEMAQSFFERSLQAANELQDKSKIAKSIRALGMLACLQNNLGEARRFLKKSLALGRELEDERIIIYSLITLGEVARTENKFEEAKLFCEETLMLCRKINYKEGASTTLCNLGAVEFCLGDFRQSAAHYAEALKMAQEFGHKIRIAIALDGFAALSAKDGKLRTAAQIAGASVNLLEQIGYELETTDRRFRDAYLAKVRAALDEEMFSQLYEQGRKLSVEKIFELVSEMR